MGLRHNFCSYGRAVRLALLGVGAFMTAAGADPSANSRLLFDPGALDRSQLGSDASAAQRPITKPAGVSLSRPGEEVWTQSFDLPDFGDASVSRGLAHGLSAPNNQLAPAETNLFEQRVTKGISIGLETEPVIKQRSPAGDRDADPERDTILDPKHQRGFLPFIGLSAKSTLQ